MSIFSTIKDAIFGHKPAAAAAAVPTPTPVATAAQPVAASAPAQAPVPAAAQAPAAPVAISEVDVEKNLTEIGAGKDLNWRTSIVDLMKLLGVDSSLQSREELAKELGYTGALDGSAAMNIWLHKATMKKLAENGGKVPADMLD